MKTSFPELVMCEGFRPSLCKISENEELSNLVVKVSAISIKQQRKTGKQILGVLSSPWKISLLSTKSDTQTESGHFFQNLLTIKNIFPNFSNVLSAGQKSQKSGPASARSELS